MTKDELKKLLIAKRREMKVVHDYIAELNRLSQEMDSTLMCCSGAVNFLYNEKYDFKDFDIDFNKPDTILIANEIEFQMNMLKDMIPKSILEKIYLSLRS